MIHDPVYHNLLEALSNPGCAVCTLTRDNAHRYLETLLYENVNDGGTRAVLRSSHGLCRRHAAEAAELHDALGLAIIYHDIASTVSRDLKRATPMRVPAPALLRRESDRPGQPALRRPAAHRPCPACAVENDVAESSLQMLVQHVAQEEMARAFATSHGLCLPHLRRALALAEEPIVIETLLRKQQQVLDSLVADLAEFIRKHNYRFAHQSFGAERDAWRRAIALLAGEPADELQYPLTPRSAQTPPRTKASTDIRL